MSQSKTNYKVGISTILAAFILISSIIGLAYIPSQEDFQWICIFFIIAFSGYAYLTFYSRPNLNLILGIGIGVRVALIAAFPNLSDDIYRFVWDGQLTAHGMNPYGYLPSDLVNSGRSWIDQGLYSNMNSPNYYTIYPPLTQGVFYISTWFGVGVFGSAVIMKCIFLLTEICTFFGLTKLLGHFGKEKILVAIYFLNPLVIVEGMGNLHFEILMVCFLVWAIYFLFIKQKILMGSFFISLSIAAKLLPLMFLPYFIYRLSNRKRKKFFAYFIVSLLLLFSPIILGLDFANFGSSIDLYFQKFEFNASVYYVLRWLGELISGYNLIAYIGPGLGLITIYLIVKRAFQSQEYNLDSFFKFSFFSFIAYLFLATTVHPWYMIVPIMISVFLRFRFAIVWSFLILMSYVNYSYEPFYENLWIVLIEYGVVIAYLYWEWKKVD